MSLPTIGAQHAAPAEDKVTGGEAMRYFGIFILGLAFLPPIVVILWRVATMPW